MLDKSLMAKENGAAKSSTFDTEVKIQKLYDKMLGTKKQYEETDRDLESKWKALREREKSLEAEERNLDEKRADYAGLMNKLHEEKQDFEKLKLFHKERLESENCIARDYIQKELEALKIKKASFEATMERERLLLSENAQTERNHMQHGGNREPERALQYNLDKMESNHRDKENAVKEQRERELEGKQLELRKGIDELNIFVKKLNDKSKLIKDFFKKHEKCKNCGKDIIDLAPSYLQILQEIENTELSSLLKYFQDCSSGSRDRNTVGSEKPAVTSPSGADCGGSISLLESAKIVNIPPLKGLETSVAQGKGEKSVEDHSNMDMKASEVPLVSESQSARPKRGINPRRGARKANSVKEVVEDAKVTVGKTRKPTRNKQTSGASDISAARVNVGSQRDSLCVHQEERDVTQDHDSGEARSVSVMANGSRKRRQTVSHESQVPEENRYNLRRRKA